MPFCAPLHLCLSSHGLSTPLLLFALLGFAAALPVCVWLLPFLARRSDTFASHREASQRGCPAAPSNALALRHRSFHQPRRLTTHISLHFYAVARRSLTLLSCCLSEHCRAHLCLAFAQLCCAAIRIVFASYRRPLPSPRHTVLCFAAAQDRAALPLPCSVKRRVAVAKYDSSPLYPRFARRRRAPACLSTALQCRCSASPSPCHSMPCRRPAWYVPAVTLLSVTRPPPRQGPRREAMISARGC